mgnify:FL=1
MNECFDVCEKADVDIYEVMTEYLQKAVIAYGKTSLASHQLAREVLL